MAANAGSDPLSQLSLALSAPADSKEQADLLATLRESLESHPSLSILCSTLLKTLSGAGDSLLKRWVLDLLHFAICRSSLSLDARTQLADQALEVLASLLGDPNVGTVKVALQCFPTVYALLFRFLCSNRNNRRPWDVLTQTKARIIELVWAPHTNNGVRLAALKFMQRVVLVQTRGINDPRLQNKDDPNIALCPTDHPFISVQALETEGMKLLEGIVKLLYTSDNPGVLSAIMNSWANLVKRRPGLVELVVSSIMHWSPTQLKSSPYSDVRSVEKSVRILLIHISRTPQGAPYAGLIQAALHAQGDRMERAAAEEKARKAAAAEASRKRATAATPVMDAPDSKRPKLEHEPAPAPGPPPTITTTIPAPATGAPPPSFDFSTLPATLVTDLIVANLQAFTENALIGLVQAHRHKKASGAATAAVPHAVATPPPAAPAGPSRLPPAQVVPTPPPTGPRASRPPSEPRADRKTKSATPPPPPPPVKEEPVDPLKMDIDDEEIEYEPDKLNLEMSGGAEAVDEAEAALDHDMDAAEQPVADFKLPTPRELEAEEREELLRKALTRIRDGAKELASNEPADVGDGPRSSSADMWMLLLVRMVTRVSDPGETQEDDEEGAKDGERAVVRRSEIYERQDRLRHALCEYIMSDFPGRVRLATTWMNEEWYNDRIQRQQDRAWQPNYETWLNQIVAAYQIHADGKDRTFSRFLLDLPQVPTDILTLLRESCVEPDRRQMGFAALREFVSQRPSLRQDAMNMLLELTTHPDKITRGAAINTVKRWIPDGQPMADMVRDFALQLLRRLQSRPRAAKEKTPERPPEQQQEDQVETGKDVEMKSSSPKPNGADHDENMEDGQLPPEDIIQTSYLPEQLELPAVDSQILQHLELLFALSTRLPEFLDEIFAAYGGMDISVQETIQQLITPLIRALGPTHGKLLTLLRTFPPGAESLALRVLTIFTEHTRPSSQLVALVKSLVNERDLDARFLIPIIAEMDKADILRHLPRIVSILNGTADPKNLVRSVFSSVVTTPPESFGKVTSNLPRVRQSELLTPAELMVLLHQSEKEIGLKSAIEAIGICFSMTEIYRSEILAVVMNQLVDEPNLPTLFLRTVIQAVTTYRSLVGFVSTTLLSRLITKKIWTNPPLWEGFIRLAKLIAPASFGALLQLPKDQLRELVDKQPGLKAGLREYVMKKGTNKARVAGYLDIFGEDDTAAGKEASPAPTPTPAPVPTPEPPAVAPAQAS
ncbi:Symplekin tight junction protein C terminal-domain-containing protein [Lenzites betulinus]|nr:Symplekin tight junction protein C terminal-domain-containing protein [Lenzites betulinus]